MSETKTKPRGNAGGLAQIRALLSEYREARRVVVRNQAACPVGGGATTDQNRRVTIAAVALAEFLTGGAP